MKKIKSVIEHKQLIFLKILNDILSSYIIEDTLVLNDFT